MKEKVLPIELFLYHQIKYSKKYLINYGNESFSILINNNISNLLIEIHNYSLKYYFKKNWYMNYDKYIDIYLF